MAEVTFTVPARFMEAFRENVYSRLAGCGDALDTEADLLATYDGPPRRPGNADEVRMEVARIAAYSRLLEQVGWDSPAREAAVVADAEPLAQVLGGALVDAGDEIHRVCEQVPLDRAALSAEMERADWLARSIEGLSPEKVEVAR